MKNKSAIFIIILILILFHGLSNYIILNKSRYCLDLNGVVYFDFINQNFQILKNIRLDLKSFAQAYHTFFAPSLKPPLFFITASPFLLFGVDKNNVIMSNLIYFAILLFATYGIGKKLYNYKVGILSAFLVSMFPGVFALSRVLIIDFALAAVVALTFYLFTLNKFNSLKFSLLTGIVVGLGALTKQAYFIFLFPILFYFFSQRENLKNIRIIGNFILLIILGSLIAAAYYAKVLHGGLPDLYCNLQEKSHINPYFYLQGILNRQLLPGFLLLFLASLIFYFRKKKYLLPLMILIPLIIFSTSTNKQDRFILPIFPYIAVMISGFICSLSKFRRLSIVILVLFSFLQYFIISYGNILPGICHFSKKSLLSPKEAVIESGLFTITDEGDWYSQTEEIIKIINDDFVRNKLHRKIKILLITQDWKINTTIDYLKITKNIPIELYKSEADEAFFMPDKKISKDFNNQITQSDFIIIEDISPDQFWFHTEHLYSFFKQNIDKFALLKTILFSYVSLEEKDKFYLADSLCKELPKKTTVHIFKNKCLKN